MLRTLVAVSAAVAAADSAWFAVLVLYAQQSLGLGALGYAWWISSRPALPGTPA